jgi:DNA-binding MarR family transcriptional regulator
MPLLMLKDLPQYECLLKAAERYPSLEPSACVAFLNLLRTGDVVFAAESEFLASRGVSHGRFTVMMLLNRGCGQASTPAELAEKAGVTRATMTGLIDTLEKDGWVARSSDPQDRRTVLVHFTERGQAVLDAILPDYFRAVSAMMHPLNPQERTQFVELLQKVQRGVTTQRVETIENADALEDAYAKLPA